MAIALDQLIDIVQADLTVSGLFERLLPNKEIKRLVKEHCLEWFYKNYQFSVQSSFYYLAKENFTKDIYTQFKYFILPEEIENITRVYKLDDPSLMQLGIQAPHLSLTMGVQAQPYLTSFVTSIGELVTYRSIISAFSDELNKLTKKTLDFSYNPINKRLEFLTSVHQNLILRVYVRIGQEDLFDNQLFKDYVTGKSRIRLGETLKRFTFNMPGQFQYNADELIAQGTALVESVTTLISGQANNGWFMITR
jgi:hypothetical protein